MRINYTIEPVDRSKYKHDNLLTINKNERERERERRNGVSKFLEMRTPPKKIRPPDVIAGGHRHLPIKLLHAENITVRLAARRMRGRYPTNYVTFKCFIIRSPRKGTILVTRR